MTTNNTTPKTQEQRIAEAEERIRTAQEAHAKLIADARKPYEAAIKLQQEEQTRRAAAVRAAIEAEQERRLMEPVRARFLAAGGTPAEFEKVWPELRAEILKRAALAAVAESDRAPQQRFTKGEL